MRKNKTLNNDTKKNIRNAFFLYILTFAKIVFPLITVPYLTRVLSTDCYGVVSYVKSFIVYAQLIVDFGFMLSSVKSIVKAQNDKDEIGRIVGNTILGKTVLAMAALLLTVAACLFLPLLQEYFLYTVLSYIVVLLSCFLLDFLFQGIEKMHYISIVFVIMKCISTVLTFVCVKGDADILWIPLLDIISSIVAVCVSMYIAVGRLGFRIAISSFRQTAEMLKDSFFYFISNMASTAFGALNTLLIGIFIRDLTDVAYWSVCSTIAAAVQTLYTPITNSIYPYMIKKKDLRYIHRILIIVMPVLFAGAGVGFVQSKFVLYIVGGEQYVSAYRLLRAFIPLLIISFPSVLYGWPTLGAVGMVKETSMSTVIAAAVQVAGLFVLVLIGRFTLINIALLRFVSEMALLLSRTCLTYKNKELFTCM